MARNGFKFPAFRNDRPPSILSIDILVVFYYNLIYFYFTENKVYSFINMKTATHLRVGTKLPTN